MRRAFFNKELYEVLSIDLEENKVTLKKGAVTLDGLDFNKESRLTAPLNEVVFVKELGLTDAQGIGYFEGDIVEFEDVGEEGYEYREGYDFINQATIVFEDGRFNYADYRDDNSGMYEEESKDHETFWGSLKYAKIVGNIHGKR